MTPTPRAGIDYIGISTPFYCVDEKGRLLMHKRSQNCRDEKGRWDSGAGQLEFGETPEEGVLREVKEEYGCKGIILDQLPPISVLRSHDGVKTHWLALVFIVRIIHDEAKNNDPKKIDEIGWFTLSTLPSPLHSAIEKYMLLTERRNFLEKYILK